MSGPALAWWAAVLLVEAAIVVWLFVEMIVDRIATARSSKALMRMQTLNTRAFEEEILREQARPSVLSGRQWT